MRLLEGEVLRIFVLEAKHITEFNVLLTVYRDVSIQYEPTGCTIYFQVISIINLTRFEQAYCSSSGGTTLYVQQLVYIMLKKWKCLKLLNYIHFYYLVPFNIIANFIDSKMCYVFLTTTYISLSNFKHFHFFSAWHIPIAQNTDYNLLMMSSKPARNMERLIIEINWK
jgi:hypothetical protein